MAAVARTETTIDRALRRYDTRLEHRGVTLRPAEDTDYEDWVDLFKSAEAALSAVSLEPSHSAEWFGFHQFMYRLENEERAWRKGDAYAFLVFNVEGDLVGGLTIGPIVSRVGRLGTWIGTPYVGKSYALRAVEAAMRFAFHEASLERVEAIVLPDNRASIRVLQHCGFFDTRRRECYMIAGVEREHLVYSKGR